MHFSELLQPQDDDQTRQGLVQAGLTNFHYGAPILSGAMNLSLNSDCLTKAFQADHMFRHYNGVLKVDGEMGDKKLYDPRNYLTLAEASMAERVKLAVSDLRAVGTTLYQV